jgi:signal peptidase I
MRKFINEIKPYVLIVIIVVLFRSFIATPAVVNGDSMDDTLNDKNLVIINKIILKINNIDRFDIVVIKNNTDGDKIIKRVIGLPNETIEYKDNVLYIDGEKMTIPSKLNFEFTNDFTAETKENEYFVLGDNRDVSKDSRYLGNFNIDDIIGKVDFRFYPFDRIGFVK